MIDSFIQMFDGLTDSLTDRQMDCLVAFDSVAEVEVVVLIHCFTCHLCLLPNRNIVWSYTAESEVEENACQDCCNTSDTPAVPSAALFTISVSEASNTEDNSVELLSADRCSLLCPVTSSSSSQTLDVESHEQVRVNTTTLPETVVSQMVEVLPIMPLASSESSTDLSNCSEEISVINEVLFDYQKWTDESFPSSRNASSSSLAETFDTKRPKSSTNQNRKRRHEDEIPEYGGLTFDKVPNYYTALSIPYKVMAGSAARSSSDLVADFMHNERDPSPERKLCSVYDKLPAYYSSFTNSTRYDDRGCLSLPEFETNFCEDETEEGRYGRSCNEHFELHDLKAADELAVGENGENSPNDNCEEEKEDSTENVSCFITDANGGGVM